MMIDRIMYLHRDASLSDSETNKSALRGRLPYGHVEQFQLQTTVMPVLSLPPNACRQMLLMYMQD